MKSKHSPYTVLDTVRPAAIEWLWQSRIPRSEITLVDGDPGTSKSTLVLDIAARCSVGMPMWGCDGPVAEPAGALLLVDEDSVSKTVIPRLAAAGANLSRIAVLDDATIPNDLAKIEEAIHQLKAQLLVIDPLMSFLRPDARSDQGVRQALRPLKKLAERTNAAVVLVRHLTKSGRHALYRGSGSIGIVGAARSALLVARDPADPNLRVIASTKSSLGPPATSLLFEPVAEVGETVRIEWRGECSYAAEDLLGPQKSTGSKSDDAKDLLRQTLENGPIEQRVIKQLAVDRGMAYRTVERAKAELGIISSRVGFGPGSVVSWSLPEAEPDEPYHANTIGGGI